MIFAFGEFELDSRQYRLRRGEDVIRLQPKVFSVLQYLIEHRERVVSKQELFDEIWPDETLTESVLARTVAVARKALGQKRGEREPIETDYGRGYRFTSDVQLLEDRAAGPTISVPTPEPAAPDLLDGEPFVGRARVMERMGELLRSAEAGRGRLCMLVGEAGIGKTRTSEMLLAQAAARGCSVWTGRCYEGDGSPAFWPWIQILRSCAREESPEQLQAWLGQGPSDLLALVPELGSEADARAKRESAAPVLDVPEDGRERRFRLFDSLTRFLQRAAEVRPRVLLLDDMHWSDLASMQLLRFLSREMGAARLLVLVTVRDPELPPGHPNRNSLDQVLAAPGAERIALSGLSAEEVGEYIATLTGGTASGSLVSAVHSRTDGNPFFMRESIRLLTDERGRLDAASSGTWTVRLPEVARDVIRRRLAMVDVELRAVLEVAAVIGREFEFTTLEQVSGLGNRALFDALGEVMALGLIVEAQGAPGHYGFAHGLIQDTLYDDMPSRRRVELHRRTAEGLEARFGTGDRGRLSEIAHHYHRALSRDTARKALHFAHMAGQAAREVFAYEEAVHHYGLALKALEYVENPSPRKRYQLLQDQGGAYGQNGRADAAVAMFQQALAVAREIDDPSLMGWAVLANCMVSRFHYRTTPETVALLREALAVVPQSEVELHSRLLGELALLRARQGATAEVEQLSAQILRGLEGRTEIEARFRVLQVRLLPLADPEHSEEALRVLAQMVELANHPERYTPWMEIVGRQSRYSRRLELGDIRGADEDLVACERLSRENRARLIEWFVEVARVGRALADGRFDGLAQRIEQTYQLGEKLRSPAAPLTRGVHFAELLVAQGATALLQNAPFDVPREAPWAGPYLELGLLRYAADIGDRDTVRAGLERAFPTGFGQLPRASGYFMALSAAAEACCAVADRERAATLYPMLLPYPRRIAVEETFVYRGAIAHYLGKVTRLLGRPEEACTHFATALEVHERTGMRPMLARTRYELARAQLELGTLSARDVASSQVERAIQLARELGMAGLLTELHALDV